MTNFPDFELMQNTQNSCWDRNIYDWSKKPFQQIALKLKKHKERRAPEIFWHINSHL